MLLPRHLKEKCAPLEAYYDDDVAQDDENEMKKLTEQVCSYCYMGGMVNGCCLIACVAKGGAKWFLVLLRVVLSGSLCC